MDTEAMSLPDRQLLPAARNFAVKSRLGATRADVAWYLEQAKRVKSAGRR
ncbi:MAG: hypothetical protein ABIQ52_21735 [Vicinamibacterales bacterium]